MADSKRRWFRFGLADLLQATFSVVAATALLLTAIEHAGHDSGAWFFGWQWTEANLFLATPLLGAHFGFAAGALASAKWRGAAAGLLIAVVIDAVWIFGLVT